MDLKYADANRVTLRWLELVISFTPQHPTSRSSYHQHARSQVVIVVTSATCSFI